MGALAIIAERRLGRLILAKHSKLRNRLNEIEHAANQRTNRHREFVDRLAEIDELLFAYSREGDRDEQENIIRTLEEIVENKPLELPTQTLESWDEDLATKDRPYAALQRRDEKKIKTFLAKYFTLRSKARLRTQLEVAKRAGLSRTHVASLERGHHFPQQQTLQKLANAFSVDITDLM